MAGKVQYRVYKLGKEGHIVGAHSMECAGDYQAIQQTEQLVDGHDLELWSGAVLIRRFQSKESKS